MAKLLDTNSLSGVFHEIKQAIAGAFDNLTPAQKAEIKGDTGATGATGPQGPQGDSAIFTGEGVPWSGLKNTTGQSTTEPMTQKAVTDELVKFDRYKNGVNETTYEHAGEIAYYEPYNSGYGNYGVMQCTQQFPTKVRFNRVLIGPVRVTDSGSYNKPYYIMKGTWANRKNPTNLTLLKSGSVPLTTTMTQFEITLNDVAELESGEVLYVYFGASSVKATILGANAGSSDPSAYTGSEVVYWLSNMSTIYGTWAAASGNRIAVRPVLRLVLPPGVEEQIDERIESARPSIVAEAEERAEEVNTDLQEFKTDVDKVYKYEGEIEYYSQYGYGYAHSSGKTAQYYKNKTGKSIKITSVVCGPVKTQYANNTVSYGIVLTTEGNRTNYAAGEEITTGTYKAGTSFSSFEVKLPEEVTVPPNYIVCVYFYSNQGGSTTLLGDNNTSGFSRMSESNRILYGGNKTTAWTVGNAGYVAVMPILKYHKEAGVKQAINEAIEDELPSIKAEVEASVDAVEVYLPDTVTAVVGDTLELFWRSIVKAVNPYAYDISVVCTKGSCLSRKYYYAPKAADVGNTTLKVNVKNRKGQLVGTATTTLVTVAAPTSPASEKKVFCIGDSLTSGGQWPCESKRRLVGSNTVDSIAGSALSNITFCGKMEATLNSTTAKYFGRGGWAWGTFQAAATTKYRVTVEGVSSVAVGATYTNNSKTFTVDEVNLTDGGGTLLLSGSGAPSASGTLTRASGSGDATIAFSAYTTESDNPLWDTANSKFSFVPYVEEYGSGDIDVLYVLLSWNGQSAWKQYSAEDTTGQIANAKTFISELHSEYPNAEVKVLGLQMPSINDGLGQNYGCDQAYSQRFGLYVCAWNYNKALQDLCNSEDYADYCEFVDIATQFDSENNFPGSNSKANKRNTSTYYAQTNGVHPSNPGYFQIADVVWRNFVKNYCQGE